jgi:hypothetical protein
MNIFFLDKTPRECARYHCDIHTVKMSLEYAQILCNVHHIHKYLRSGIPLYKPTHMRHPIVLWASENQGNYAWLYTLWQFTLEEYSQRYLRKHKSEELTSVLASPPFPAIKYNYPRYIHPNLNPNSFSFRSLTLPPLCMPYDCKPAVVKTFDDVVKAYREYYIMHKGKIAKWDKTPDRPMPYWIGTPEIASL